ncbi:disintegrin and metalloproteinase domain-containing protein [Plakobranchus ocellatus]|uniref:Disintegrin and metalloproteinase domain-containing protein n=1 Tax=Plakobranchus ocellatus TaxID=259542 RepID=A0AAV4B2N8_9GAST|nr:disintegrin and metalloproteinase domain-containing protein [Plakobranchus ocellatus]
MYSLAGSRFYSTLTSLSDTIIMQFGANPSRLFQEMVQRPHQGDLRLSSPPSGQGAGGGAQTRDRRIPADVRANSLALCHRRPHSKRE